MLFALYCQVQSLMPLLSIKWVYSWFSEGKEFLMVHVVQDGITFRTPFPNWLWIHLVYQHMKFAMAVSKCWGFYWGISEFFSICLVKKNAKATEFLEIVRNKKIRKYIFLFLKKRNVLLNKKRYFYFNFHDAGHLLYYPQMSVFSFHTFVVLLYQFLRHRA